uniref:Uncharacterized protein n=1 Tax=Oncorhynchus mykiss TaxID=8022 RepID=A0A8C7WDK2_ONCMY
FRSLQEVLKSRSADVKKKGVAADQKTAAKTALVHTYADPKTFKQHFESKHSKSPMVPVLVDM